MRQTTKLSSSPAARFILFILLASIFALLGVGCQKGDTQSGEGPLIFRMTDTPEDVAHLWVTLEGVSTRLCRGGGWIDLPTITEAFDLIALSGDDAFKTINQAALTPYGSYCETRLMLSEEATVETTEGETYSLKVPSQEIKIKGEYEVRPSSFTIVTLDFDVDQSLHRAGNSGKYTLNPVIFIEDVEYEPMEIGEEHYYYLKEIVLGTPEGNGLAEYMNERYDWKLPDCQYGRSYAFDPENDPETFLFLMCSDVQDPETFGQYVILVSEWFSELEPFVSVMESSPENGLSMVYMSESGALTRFPLPRDFSGEGGSALSPGAPENLRNLPLPVNHLSGEEN